MHIFITGGSGLTGPAIVAELIEAGHAVTGLARSDASAARLKALGAAVHRGSLDDLDSLRAGAEAADGVIHMAFGGSFADPDDLARRDLTAIQTLGQALVGTGKPFVSTSGTFLMTAGRVSHEQDPPDPTSIASFRIPGEQACLAFAGQGVRSSVIRLAPTVHGPGDYGFIAMLIAAARRTGVSAYIDEGANRWPAIHRHDAATLFRLAIEKAPAGSALHGAGESALTFETIAHHVGRTLGIPTASLTLDEAAEHLRDPFLARAFATDAPASVTALARCWAGRQPIPRCWRTWTPVTTSPHRTPDPAPPSFGNQPEQLPEPRDKRRNPMTDHDPATDTIRAVRFHDYGEPADVLHLETIGVPTPGPGRIRIRVHACGLTPADWALCRGLFPGQLPRGVGTEISGVIDAIGDGVSDVTIGQAVFGTADWANCPSAGAADKAIMDNWTPVPDGLDLTQAAALPMALETAHRSLDQLELAPDQTILIHGGGTTIGYAAVQIARHRGARVITTAGDTYAQRLRDLGATVTPYGDGMVERIAAINDGPVDLVLDTAPVGGALSDLIQIAGGDPKRVLTISHFEEAERLGVRDSFHEQDQDMRFHVFGEYAQLAAEGKFTIPIAATFGLDDWRTALDSSLTGHAHGKLLLLPDENTGS